jgi:hypothetical protein
MVKSQKDIHQEMLRQAEVANQAAQVAKDVACEAKEVAKKVVEEARANAEKVLLFSQTMEYIQKDISEIKTKLDNKYVSKEEFATVKSIVYGLVSLILIAVVGAGISILFK